MENYNFWQDFFDTYQSLSDVVKALWLIVPPAFVLGLIALFLHDRRLSKLPPAMAGGNLIYTIHRDDLDRLHIYRHGREGEDHPALLFVEKQTTGSVESSRSGDRQ